VRGTKAFESPQKLQEDQPVPGSARQAFGAACPGVPHVDQQR
jgi:hypothetical protein